MADRYTKIVLTVIAASLAGILIAQLTPEAQAQGAACGSANNPCYVKVLSY